MNDGHCRKLTKLQCDHQQRFLRGTMTPYPFDTVNENGVMFTSPSRNVEIMKVLKDGYRTVMLGGRHGFHSVKPHKEEDEVCSSAILCVCATRFCLKGLLFLPLGQK